MVVLRVAVFSPPFAADFIGRQQVNHSPTMRGDDGRLMLTQDFNLVGGQFR